MPERITSSNLKAEILEAYNELEVEYKLLNNQVETLEQEKAQLAEEKSTLEEQTLPPAPTDGAAPDTVDAVVETLSALRVHFSGAINRLSAQLTEEVRTLETRREEARAAARQLQALHDLTLDEEDDTLGRLIREYEETAAAQEAECEARRRTVEQDLAERQSAWAAEQEAHERAVETRDRTRELARKRDQEEYAYQRERTRRQEADAHEQEMKQLHRELDDTVRQAENAWAEREQGIADREQTFNALEARVETFPDEIEAAARSAREEATARVRREAERKAALRGKEVEGEMQVYQQRVEALEDALARQTQHLERLDERLAETAQQAQDLAFRAIDSGSRAGTYEAIREIAIEQAKGKHPGKET